MLHLVGLENPEGGEQLEKWGSFGRGAFEALWVTAAFVSLGLCWAEIVKRAPIQREMYPSGGVEIRAPEDPSVWLVDGFNVVQRVLLGGRDRDEWWTAPRRAELLERAGAFDDPAAEVWVVFDGPDAEWEERGACRPRQVFARSADDWLLARILAAEDPGQVAIVTDDRRLAGRARRRGARVVSPIEFLRRCSSGGTSSGETQAR